jgi:hypothetical protein
LEKKFELEISNKEKLIQQLGLETKEQSNLIAKLTHQIHNMKVKQAKQLIISNDQTDLTARSNSSLCDSQKGVNNSSKISILSIKNTASLQPSNKLNKIKKNNDSPSNFVSIDDTATSSTSSLNDIQITHQRNRSNSVASSKSTSSRIEKNTFSSFSFSQDIEVKVLLPVVRKSHQMDSNHNIIPDPTPFLQSVSSKLYSRNSSNSKESLNRHNLITLPPIKHQIEVNKLAVESPHKTANLRTLNKAESSEMLTEKHSNAEGSA